MIEADEAVNRRRVSLGTAVEQFHFSYRGPTNVTESVTLQNSLPLCDGKTKRGRVTKLVTLCRVAWNQTLKRNTSKS